MKTPAILLLLATSTAGQQLCGDRVDERFLTRPERTAWSETSTSADVSAFVRRLHEAYPGTFQLRSIGATLQGRSVQAVVANRAGADQPVRSRRRLRAVIQANIHGGEIEGKEAVQVILREIAMGGHRDILKDCDVWFVPIFNLDGNDEMHPRNRTSQNGPAVVGKRSNAQGLDLNRDFVKVESPEARAMIGLFNEVDPHLYMDLHTTNGTTHGYHLTYAPSLSINQDEDLASLMHDRFLPAVRSSILKNHGFRIFDYGNASRRGDPVNWSTYGHTPRYATNYVGLRNRLSLLSEAYSYLPFKQRALVTRAFVIESLRELVRRRKEVLELCERADQRVVSGGARLGYDTSLVRPVPGKILMGSVEREGSRRVANAAYKEVSMGLQIRYAASESKGHPLAWVITDPSDAVRRALLVHGLQVDRVTAAVTVSAQSFKVRSKTRARYVYEGHKVVTLQGDLQGGRHAVSVGALLVRSQQRLGRVAAQLLEPHSEDSLATWNFFDAQLAGADGRYPVLRIVGPDALRDIKSQALPREDLSVQDAYVPAPGKLPGDSVVVRVVCVTPGQRASRGGYEQTGGWKGRKLAYLVGGQRLESRSAFHASIAELFKAGARPCVLKPGNAITAREMRSIARDLNKAGASVVYLDRKPE